MWIEVPDGDLLLLGDDVACIIITQVHAYEDEHELKVVFCQTRTETYGDRGSETTNSARNSEVLFRGNMEECRDRRKRIRDGLVAQEGLVTLPGRASERKPKPEPISTPPPAATDLDINSAGDDNDVPSFLK